MPDLYPGPLPDESEDDGYLPVRPMANLAAMSGAVPVSSGAAPLMSSRAPAAGIAPPGVSGASSPYAPIAVKAPSAPNVRADIASGNVAPPVSTDYQPAKPTWRQRIAAGMVAFKSPQLGEEMMQEPVRQAQQRYANDTSEYNTLFGQGLKQQEDDRANKTAQSEDTLRQAQGTEANARADALKNPELKPKAGQLVFDKAGNAVGYQDETGNLMAPDNPKLPPDVGKILSSAKPKPEPEKNVPLEDQYDAAVKSGDKGRASQILGEMKQTSDAKRKPGDEDTADLSKQMKELQLQELQKKVSQPTADEQRRADLSNNLNENLDQLEDIAKRRPDLFGPLSGRMTQLKGITGTSDPDVAALNTIREQMGMAMVGAHAMRNAQHVEKAANSIVNNFHNSPEAMMSAIQEARNSVKTFQNDAAQAGKQDKQQAAAGGKQPNDGGLSVQAGGKTYTFKDQKSADAFKKEAGIK